MPKTTNDAMELAESSRETEWKHESVLAELFKGRFRWDLISPFPTQPEVDRIEGDKALSDLAILLKKHVDPVAVDLGQDLPRSATEALAAAGFFGMKIPKEYGGLGLSVTNYVRAMALVGSWCGTTAVWLSAHQSIGAPQPLKLYGTPEQKARFLPRLAKGAISAFALTEPNVGSDPAQMTTTARLSDDGSYYILNGDKLYCTNGTAAELIVVMALTEPKIVNGKEKKQVTALIVETSSPGFEVVYRCKFMGIRGIASGLLRFKDVKVPVENRIGEPGQGLRIALATLNTGRLTIPAISAAAGKVCVEIVHDWAGARVQWGTAIGNHQAIRAKTAPMIADTYAMDAVSALVSAYADQAHRDIRLEAAVAKYFGSEKSWRIVDDTLQIRGGRGYETETSLAGRGEVPYGVERMFRDLRINRIIEGTSEVMQLFIAREALDFHARRIFPLMDSKTPLGAKVSGAIKAFGFYAIWYPTLWVPSVTPLRSKRLSWANRRHLYYIRRASRKLARRLFHTMMRYQAGLEREQVLLAHYVDIGTDLFVMMSTLAKAEVDLATTSDPNALQDLVNFGCREARLRISQHFCRISCHRPGLMMRVSSYFNKGAYRSMMTGIIHPRE